MEWLRELLLGTPTQQQLIPAMYQLAIRGTLGYTLARLSWSMSQDLAEWLSGEAPAICKNQEGVPFGKVSGPFGLWQNTVRFPEGDNRHKCYVGATRMGKTETSAQFVQHTRQGVAYLCNDDGKIVDRMIAALPPERLEKLVVINHEDPSWIIPIGLVLRPDDYHLQDTITNQWSSFFENNFNVESMYLTSEIISYACRAVFALNDTTFYDVYLMVKDPSHRLRIIARLDRANYQHRELIDYWKSRMVDDNAEEKLQRESAAFLRRANSLFRDRMIQYTLGKRPENMNYRYWMENGFTVLIKTPESLGENTVRIIQAIHAISFWQAALMRDRLPEHERKPFWLIADEPQTWLFNNAKTIDNIFSKAAKYRLFMILAFQSFAQISDENPKLLRKIQDNAPDLLVFRTSKKQLDVKIKNDPEFELEYQPRFKFVAGIDGNRFFKCNSLGKIPRAREWDEVNMILRANRQKYNVPYTKIARVLEGRNQPCQPASKPQSSPDSPSETKKSSPTFTLVE